MSEQRLQPGWIIALWWTLSTDVGIVIGMLLIILLIREAVPLIYPADPGVLLTALVGSIGGAVVGTAQWVVLRRYLPEMGRWIVATSAGFALWLPISGRMPDVIVLFSVLLGASVGFAQWLVLRRLFLRAAWWIVASTVGSVALWEFGLPAGLLGVTLYGAITGGTMAWLLRQPVVEDPDASPAYDSRT